MVQPRGGRDARLAARRLRHCVKLFIARTPGARCDTSVELLSIEPARYYPFSIGKYEVKAGLSRFGKDFGNGKRDQLLFQRDRLANQYLDAKRAARKRDLSRYYVTQGFDADVRDTVCDFIEARLKFEYPEMMRSVALTGPDRFDSLAMLVQEDLCVLRVEPDRNWLAAAHVCLANGWSPVDKVGKDFFAIHEPVAHIDPVNAAAQEHAQVMARAVDGLVRFAWGLQFHDELDKHPDLAKEQEKIESLDHAQVRVERQTMWGLPTAKAALFTIRAYLYRCDLLTNELKHSLANAVETMSPQSRAYKGLTRWAEPLIDRMRTPD